MLPLHIHQYFYSPSILRHTHANQKVAYDDQLRESLQLSFSGIQAVPSDILSAEVDRLRDTLKQRDRQLEQQNQDLAQERAELAHQQQQFEREIAFLKEEQEQSRPQPPIHPGTVSPMHAVDPVDSVKRGAPSRTLSSSSLRQSVFSRIPRWALVLVVSVLMRPGNYRNQLRSGQAAVCRPGRVRHGRRDLLRILG